MKTTTATHTPGPWSYHSYKASGKRFGIETADHKHGIAAIAPNETASTLIAMDEHEANARLIAAAPELLESCQAIVKEAYGKRTSPGISAAYAAIAKAVARA